MIKLTPEQTEQAVQHPAGIECQGDGTEKTFVIVDADVMQRMRRDLCKREVHEAITEGIADMEAGNMMSLDESQAQVRTGCDLPSRNDT